MVERLKGTQDVAFIVGCCVSPDSTSSRKVQETVQEKNIYGGRFRKKISI